MSRDLGDIKIEVTVNDEVVFPVSESIRGSRSSDSRGTAQFRVRATHAMPESGQSVGIYDRGIRIFGGMVFQVDLTPIAHGGSEAWYDITCTSWEHRLERHRIPAVAYDCSHEGGPANAGEVVQLILDTYALGEVVVGSIQPGALAAELGILIYRGVSVAEALDDLAKRSNYVWYVDPERNLFFVPSKFSYAISEVRASNLNYREPEIHVDPTDYYNKVSLAINYDAFAPWVNEFLGDVCYPTFTVYTPGDDEKKPVPIDVIRYIRINGVDQEFGVKVLDANGEIADRKVFYYRPGSAEVEWDDQQPTPSADDVITIEFYQIGANVVEAQDDAELAACQARQADWGIYHAYLEDFECHEATVALARCEQFLDRHCPGRNGKEAGYMPRQYVWRSDSHRFSDDFSAWVDDLMPGRIITFWPTTPINTNQEVIIQSVEFQSLGTDPDIFRYTVTAVDAIPIGDVVGFYKALAELSPTKQGIPDFTEVLDVKGIVFGIDTAAVSADIGWHPEVAIHAGQIWRPTSARVTAETAPVGADLLIDCAYSEDAGVTWNNLFVSTDGDLVLGDGLNQSVLPLGKFYGFPTPLDVPARSIIRCAVKQVGSTTAGSKVIVEIVGEVRKAAATVTA